MSAPDFEYIPGRYGYWLERTGDGSIAGRIPLEPALCTPDGHVRTAALLMAADMTCAMAEGFAAAGANVVVASQKRGRRPRRISSRWVHRRWGSPSTWVTRTPRPY